MAVPGSAASNLLPKNLGMVVLVTAAPIFLPKIGNGCPRQCCLHFSLKNQELLSQAMLLHLIFLPNKEGTISESSIQVFPPSHKAKGTEHPTISQRIPFFFLFFLLSPPLFGGNSVSLTLSLLSEFQDHPFPHTFPCASSVWTHHSQPRRIHLLLVLCLFPDLPFLAQFFLFSHHTLNTPLFVPFMQFFLTYCYLENKQKIKVSADGSSHSTLQLNRDENAARFWILKTQIFQRFTPKLVPKSVLSRS